MSVTILGIDPGPKQTGWAQYGPEENLLFASGVVENNEFLETLENGFVKADYCVCEWITNRGMPVGHDTFETVFWIGRYYQAMDHIRLQRREVQIHMCGSTKATDANVAQAVRNRFEPTGGGSKPEVGVKKQPGPLYGIKADAYSALALAITLWEKHIEPAQREVMEKLKS